jgi:hypothetical protein
MSAIVAARAWLRRMAAAAPSAWHYDPVFRWSAIGAGLALALFILRFAGPPAPNGAAPVPGTSVPTNLGPSYGAATGSSLAPQTPPPKIAPGRSLDGVTITPGPERDPFGTVPPATHR